MRGATDSSIGMAALQMFALLFSATVGGLLTLVWAAIMCSNPWTVGSVAAAAIKLVLDVVCDSKEIKGLSFNDVVVRRHATCVAEGESFFFYYRPLLELWCLQLSHVLHFSVGVYGYSKDKALAVQGLLRKRIKAYERKQTVVNCILDETRLDKDGKAWVDTFVQECTLPVAVSIPDAVDKLMKAMEMKPGSVVLSKEYDEDTCCIALLYKHYNESSDRMSFADKKELAEESVRFSKMIGAERVSVWIDYNCPKVGEWFKRGLSPYLACPVVRSSMSEENRNRMWLSCEEVLSLAHGGFTKECRNEDDYIKRLLMAPRCDEVFALFADMWACGAADQMQLGDTRDRDKIRMLAMQYAEGGADITNLWKFEGADSGRSRTRVDAIGVAGRRWTFGGSNLEVTNSGLGITHLSAMNPAISKLGVGSNYLRKKSRNERRYGLGCWGINQDVDNRKRSPLETESALHDARLFVSEEGRICWLVANVGKSRVVRKITVDKGDMKLNGHVTSVEMVIWSDGVSSEEAIEEDMGCKPAKSVEVRWIRWKGAS